MSAVIAIQTPDSIASIMARMDAQDAIRDAFICDHFGRSFQGTPRPSSGLTSVIVSPALDASTGYRLTRIDNRGPSGHTEFKTYRDAVRAAVIDYGVDLGTVTFAGEAT